MHKFLSLLNLKFTNDIITIKEGKNILDVVSYIKLSTSLGVPVAFKNNN